MRGGRELCWGEGRGCSLAANTVSWDMQDLSQQRGAERWVAA